MPLLKSKPVGKIDRRSPNAEGEPDSPIVRENLISRDKRLLKVKGTTRAISAGTGLTARPTWMGRYYTIEIGAEPKKTFIYTIDGKLWVMDDTAHTVTMVKNLLNENAYPKHWLFKTQNQTKMYWVDGLNLYKFDGNNDNNFQLVPVNDSNGDPVGPKDVIEHKDRLFLLTDAYIFISKNLDPDVFDDPTDSAQIIVGSGKGKNLAFGKIEDKLYIFNTEGIFILYGDVISAIASTFEVRILEERRIIASRSLVKVERSLMFLADDYNIWSWDGSTSTKISHSEKLEDFVGTYRAQLDKAVATYYNNFYMLSIVEPGEYENHLEVWWDAFENKIDFIRGRNVSCYMQTDPNIEVRYLQTGRSDVNCVMNTDDTWNFDGIAIPIRIRTRDLIPAEGRNVRFTAFYPDIGPIGNRQVHFEYFLDGLQSNLVGNVSWDQSLKGQVIPFGFIELANQEQFTDRIRPKINYAKGTSIAIEIRDATLDMQFEIRDIKVEYVDKFAKKGKKIGQ